MEKPLALLRADLEQLGFRRQEHVSESEDHIAALCDVMGMISGEAADADRQAAFFTAHIAPWAPRFFEDLQNAPSARFYRVVGFLGERFMRVESKYLDVKAEPVERRTAT
jgi:TorA maturation chaperone TorD